MPDVWSTFPELDATMQERLASVLEIRGADPQQQEMRQGFLANVAFPPNARVLEVGCGTGVLTRALALRPNAGTVVGVDVAPSLLGKARDLAAEMPDLTFQEADGRSLPFGTKPAMSPSSTLRCPMYPVPNAPSPRRSGCCVRWAGWRPSMATTRPPR